VEPRAERGDLRFALLRRGEDFVLEQLRHR
jgi:hypothetical protein